MFVTLLPDRLPSMLTAFGPLTFQNRVWLVGAEFRPLPELRGGNKKRASRAVTPRLGQYRTFRTYASVCGLCRGATCPEASDRDQCLEPTLNQRVQGSS